MTYLLDTNVLSEIRKPNRHPHVADWLGQISHDELFVSVLAFGEIRRGIQQLGRRDIAQATVFEDWLADLRQQFVDRVLSIDAAVAEAWGRITAGRPAPVIDGLMAATALVHGFTVVTRDREPFERVGVPWLDPWSS